MKHIATKFFQDNPSLKDGVLKAYYAYHAPHFRLDDKAHNFTNSSRASVCQWCGRSREDVRWDDIDPQCQSRPLLKSVEDVILEEECKAFSLLEKASIHIPKIVSKLGLSGETLAVLHHTHGYDPETVAGCVDLSSENIKDYHEHMENQRNQSRQSRTVEVIKMEVL